MFGNLCRDITLRKIRETLINECELDQDTANDVEFKECVKKIVNNYLSKMSTLELNETSSKSVNQNELLISKPSEKKLRKIKQKQTNELQLKWYSPLRA